MPYNAKNNANKNAKNSGFTLTLIAAAILMTGCGGGGSDAEVPSPSPVTPQPSTPAPAPQPSVTVDVVEPNQTPNTLAAGDCEGNVANDGAMFKNISAAAGLCYSVNQTTEDSIPSRVGGGIAVNDIDADGRLDFYVTQGRDSVGRLFQQTANYGFENITESSGIRVSSTDFSANFIDLDEDGDQDFVTMTETAPFIQFFANQGEGRFNEISHLVDIEMTKWTYSMAAGDIDDDGDLDLFFAHWDPENKQHRWEYLWQRTGPGIYRDISAGVELEPFGIDEAAEDDDEFSFTPIFADVNNDAMPDLLVAADWGTSQYLVNNGAGGFVDDTIPQVITDRAGMGAAVGDYDNDGDLDWFVTAIGDPREQFLTVSLFDGNRLYDNDGNGNFLNFTDFADVRQGYWAWGTCFADFNNDGFEDIYVVNGYAGWNETQAQSDAFDQFRETPALLYINRQNGTFVESAEEYGVADTGMGRGLACFDYDKDGDVDILISNNGSSPALLRNDSEAAEQHFINVKLKGLKDNPQAVGARIYVKTSATEQMRELQLGNHYVSQNPVEAHFGLGGVDTIEEVRIIWPGTQQQETVLTNIPVDRFITVHHPDSD